MGIRNDVKRHKTGADLNTVEANVTSGLGNVAGFMNSLGLLQTHINNESYFTQADKDDVTDIVTENWAKIWKYAVDNTPQAVKDAYTG